MIYDNTMNKNTILLLFSFCFTQISYAQTNQNQVYVDYIKTVKLHPEGFELNFPMVALNSGNFLVLSFDDVSEYVQDYSYTITLMDKDWQPSLLSTVEYLDGFDQNIIEDYDFSFKTNFGYTNYSLYLPNEDVAWTKSGNYLLKVFNEDQNQELVFTQRFVVFEQEIQIVPNIVRPSVVSKSQTHQEIDFTIDHEGLQIRNPRTEISATIIQNERWDNAIQNIPPAFLRLQQLSFDYQNKIIFPAGNEFRFLDMRSFRVRNGNIAELKRGLDKTEIYLQPDVSRINEPYLSVIDLNGDFMIENIDLNRNFNNLSRDTAFFGNGAPIRPSVSRSGQANLNSDYAEVWFFLKEPQLISGHSVHILGEFNQWQPNEQNKMVYNEAVNSYVGKLLMKQGYYDYAYGIADPDTRTLNLSEMEGNRFETINEYTILIYFRPFGQRYDRIIGTASFTSGL